MANETIPTNLFLSTTVYDRNYKTRNLSGQQELVPGGNGYKLVRYKSEVDFDIQLHKDFDLTDTNITIEAYNGNIKSNGSIEYGSLPQIDTGTNTIHVVFLRPHSSSFILRIKVKGVWLSTGVETDMIEYVEPTCIIEKKSYNESTHDLDLTLSGKYFNAPFWGTPNTYLFQWRKRALGGTWSDWSYNDGSHNVKDLTFSGFNYSAIGYFSPNTNTVNEYQFQLTDKLTSVLSNILIVQTTPIFDWSNEDFHFGVPVRMDKRLEMSAGIYLQGNDIIMSGGTINLGTSGDIIRNGQSIFNNTNSFRATNNFSATKAISDTNAIKETSNNISITTYNPTWINSNLSSGSHNFTFYIIQPFNLVLLRGYISGFSSALSSSTSYINLCKFNADFGAADISALSVSGPKPCSAIINTDGYIKIIVPEGISTETQLYITGIYPLNNNSSYYQG